MSFKKYILINNNFQVGEPSISTSILKHRATKLKGRLSINMVTAEQPVITTMQFLEFDRNQKKWVEL